MLDTGRSPAGDTWFCVRRNGVPKREGWTDAAYPADLPRRLDARGGEVVEVSVAEAFRPVAFHRFSRVFHQRARGLAGMELAFRGEVVRFAPTRMIAANLRFERALERFLERRGASVGELSSGGSVRAFSARHYRARNPAFVPWHTQASASLFAQTGRRELADFAFEINDWLLPMQQWDGLAPDLRGRFHDPRRPEFGPPHAASTGAYMEGLADALALARAVGDRARAAAYERALRRGLRSLRQLQFRDWRDAFYVSRKRRVMGALRTEVYDNAVRVDSAAHALMAAIRILQPMTSGSRRASPG